MGEPSPHRVPGRGAGVLEMVPGPSMTLAGVKARLLAICHDLAGRNKLVKLDKLFNIARRELRVESRLILDAIRHLEDDLLIKQDSRLTRAGLLANETRRLVYFTIRDRPGMSFNQLRSVTGKGTNVVLWHVSVLLDFGCILEMSFDGSSKAYFTHHFDDDDVPGEVRFMCAMMQGGTAGAILGHLAAAGEATTRDIEQATGASRQLVDYHVKRLEAAGVVIVNVDGVKRIAITPGHAAAFAAAERLCRGQS